MKKEYSALVDEWWQGQLSERRLRERIKYLRDYDPETHLLNEKAFLRHGTRRLGYAARNKFPIMLLFGDCDGLKQANKTLGHKAGDAIIKTVSKIYLSHFRKEDLLCRMHSAGDELLSLFLACPDSGHVVAERLREKIENCEPVEGQRISISIGLLSLIPTAEDLPSLIERVRQLCDEAKDLGKNRIVFESQIQPINTPIRRKNER